MLTLSRMLTLISLEQTARLLDYAERTRGAADPLTHWLRARSLMLIESAIERTSLSVEGLGGARQERGVQTTLELLSPALEELRSSAAAAEQLCQYSPLSSPTRVALLLQTAASALANRLHEAFHCEVRGLLTKEGTEGASSEVWVPRLKTVLEALDAFGARAGSIHPVLGRTPLCYLAIELCLRLDAAAIVDFAKAPRLDLFAERIARLTSELRHDLWALDAQRALTSLGFFEGWLTQALAPNAEDSGSPLTLRLNAIEIIERLSLEAGVSPWAYCRALPFAAEPLLRTLAQLRSVAKVKDARQPFAAAEASTP